MADLKKLNTSIDRFLLNEKRIEQFINDELGYVADNGIYVPSLKEISRKIETGEINITQQLKIYSTYNDAILDAPLRNDGLYSRVLTDETRENRDTIYLVLNDSLLFIKYEDLPEAIDSGTY